MDAQELRYYRHETVRQVSVAALIEVGGSEWKKQGYHRVYFDDLHEWYGLELMYYNSGNIRAAWLNDEKISNTRGGEILEMFSGARLWYDVASHAFVSQGLSAAVHRIVVRSIVDEIEAVQEPTTESEGVEATEPSTVLPCDDSVTTQ